MTLPYAEAAPELFERGWSPFPLKFKTKAPVPIGYTGAQGKDVDATDLERWLGPNARVEIGQKSFRPGNVAIRLPRYVLGVDVDAYGEKAGETTLAAAEKAWGPLPRTWVSTSRTDDLSGIRLYRIPEGLAWPGQLPQGGGVELIRWDDRFAIVAPSVHPDTGHTYKWHREVERDGEIVLELAEEPPAPDDLPELPSAWIDGLTNGAPAIERAASEEMGAAELQVWLDGRVEPDEPCETMQRTITKYSRDIRQAGDDGGAHDTARNGAWAVLGDARTGHAGVKAALTELRAIFLEAVKGRRKNAEEAKREWKSFVARGAAKVAAEAVPLDGDPCDGSEEVAARFVLVSAAELAKPVPPMRWLVRGVWPEKSHGVLAGAKKSLKSWNALALAIAVASGRPYLDKFDVDSPGPVLIFNGEGGQDPFARRYQRLAEAYGCDAADLPISATFDVGSIDSRALLDTLKAALDAIQPALVILDPLYLYHPAKVEAQNLYERGRMLGKFGAEVGHETALMVVDHYRKTGGSTLDLDEIGQSGMAQWVDSWILQAHHKDSPDLGAGSFALATEFGSRQTGGRRWLVGWSCPFDFELGEPSGEISWTVEPYDGSSGGPRRSSLVDVEVLIMSVVDAAGGWEQKTKARVAARKLAEENGVKFSNERFAEAWVSLVSEGRLTEESRPVPEGNRSVNRSGAQTSSPEVIKLNASTRPRPPDELPGEEPF